MAPIETADLMSAAALGDSSAWDALVDRYAGVVWNVARACGLSSADAADVSQTTWLRLTEHLPRLREPERVAAWLVTTARREAIRAQARSRRERPLDSFEVVDREDVGHRLLERERSRDLWQAFAAIPPPCQVLLRLLLTDCSYAEISEALDMPVGSIGPRRQRCLQQLRVRFLAGDIGEKVPAREAG